MQELEPALIRGPLYSKPLGKASWRFVTIRLEKGRVSICGPFGRFCFFGVDAKSIESVSRAQNVVMGHIEVTLNIRNERVPLSFGIKPEALDLLLRWIVEEGIEMER